MSRNEVRVRVQFFSYFKELAGCGETEMTLPDGSTMNDLVEAVFARFPRLRGMEKSMLKAVGVEYQAGDYVIRTGDEVSLFPPVQGG